MDVFSCTKSITAEHCGLFTPLECPWWFSGSLSPPRATEVVTHMNRAFRCWTDGSSEGKCRMEVNSCMLND